MKMKCLSLVLYLIFSFSLFEPTVYSQVDFTMQAPSTSSMTVSPGGTSSPTTIKVTPNPGFAANITLTASGLPNGATPNFSPTPFASPYTGGSTFTVLTTTSVPAGSYTIIVIGTPVGGGDPVPSSPITLTVQPPPNSTPSGSPSLNDFGFGVALGLSTNVTGADIVNNATIDANGIVRVNTRANTTAGFMLETHYYIWPRPPKEDPKTGTTPPDTRRTGVGPFVAVQPGSSQIISAVGAGLMIGFRRPAGTKPTGFGLGFGYESIPAAQVLGSEFVNGQKAPIGPDGLPIPIRYETEDKGAALIVLSVNF